MYIVIPQTVYKCSECGSTDTIYYTVYVPWASTPRKIWRCFDCKHKKVVDPPKEEPISWAATTSSGNDDNIVEF